MGLGNPLEVVVHNLLIGGVTYLGYQDGFPMVCALVHNPHKTLDKTYGESWLKAIK